jgi:hypothetical protein
MKNSDLSRSIECRMQFLRRVPSLWFVHSTMQIRHPIHLARELYMLLRLSVNLPHVRERLGGFHEAAYGDDRRGVAGDR